MTTHPDATYRDWRAYRFICSDGVNEYREIVQEVQSEAEARAGLVLRPGYTIVSSEEVRRLNPLDLGPRP